MSGRIPFGNIDVHLVASMTEGRGIPDEEIPFRILVMGDFSGRANRRVSDSRIALRRPISVDRDNIDEVLAKLRVELVLSVLGEEREPFSVSFAAMDDFHPDRLFERLACFDAVKHLKNRLKSQDIAKVLKEGGKKPSWGESGDAAEGVAVIDGAFGPDH